MIFWFTTTLGCQLNTRNVEINIQLSAEEPSTANLHFEVEWDGEDGFFVRWEPPQDYTYLQLHTIDGVAIAETTSENGTASFSDLTEGEYRIYLHEDATSDAIAHIDQWNGENRLLYRSEVPVGEDQIWGPSGMSLQGESSPVFGAAMDVWGEDDIGILAGGTHRDIGLLIADVRDAKEPEVLAEIADIGFVRDVKSGDGLLFWSGIID